MSDCRKCSQPGVREHKTHPFSPGLLKQEIHCGNEGNLQTLGSWDLTERSWNPTSRCQRGWHTRVLFPRGLALIFPSLPVFQGRFRQGSRAGAALAVAVVGSLCADAEVRARLARSRECWQACLVKQPGECSQPSLPFVCSPHSPETFHSVWDLG